MISNQRKLRLNQTRNKWRLHRKVPLCLCETDPHLQLVPSLVTACLSAMQQLSVATNPIELLLWVARTSLSSHTQNLHVYHLPALPRNLPVPASVWPCCPCMAFWQNGCRVNALLSLTERRTQSRYCPPYPAANILCS